MMMTNNPNDGRRTGDPCPHCEKGSLSLRKNGRTGGYFLGCDRFPDCGWSCCSHPRDVAEVRRATRRRKRAKLRTLIARERRTIERRWELEDESGRAAMLRSDEWRPSDEEPETERALWIWM
jgi:ssDNA-binding Zn-finger/Zn-ribbon topoisomerase 1